MELTVETTSTIQQKCSHHTGWYGYASFFFGLFKKRYYVCSLCGEFIPTKGYIKSEETA